MRWLRFIIVAAVLLLHFFGCTDLSDEQRRAPRLAVVLVIDQFRYDYLIRFAGLWNGGIARLLDEGVLFTNAFHRHAITETAPGHATLLTGCHPSRHGIIGDYWYERETQRSVYCVDESIGMLSASIYGTGFDAPMQKGPRQLLRSTLGDWLKSQNAASKVVSISAKDCAAILMGGPKADAAYWIDSESGRFVTSSYYQQAPRPWVQSWNELAFKESYRDSAWTKLLSENQYLLAREDLFSAEADGIHNSFPHRLGDDGEVFGATYYERLFGSPFGDRLTLDFALESVRHDSLGADRNPDLLCISLSASDAIGHIFGPLSQEMQDNLVRLDLNLGRFLFSLDEIVGLDHCLIAISADHGIMAIPEELRRRGSEAARVPTSELMAEIGEALTKSIQETASQMARPAIALEHLHNGLYLSDSSSAENATEMAAIKARLAQRVRALSFLEDAFTADELLNDKAGQRAYMSEFRHSFHRGRSPDIMLRARNYFLIGNDSAQGTNHGSVYEYDAHVPLLFWGKKFKPGRVEVPAATIDFAPTLARAMGIAVPEDVDGSVLTSAFKDLDIAD